jgi:signal transduction histidine kinase
MLTLRLRLLMLWLFALAVCVALAFILRSVYQLGTEAQTEKTLGLAKLACGELQTQYPRSLDPVAGPLDKVLMLALLNGILDAMPGVEGGFWHDGEGFVAYAFPTHQGSEPKRDVPATERGRIEGLVRETLAAATPRVELLHGTRETVILTACPVGSADARLGAWTMARVPIATGRAYDEVMRGLALLLLFVVGSGLWLGYSFFRWTRDFGRIETALRGARVGDLLNIEPAKDAELNRIIAALNDFSARLRAAQARAAELDASLERAERFAALGRMAASVAHEVRNPIAAVRLKAENALAQPERQGEALSFVLREIERVERIVRTLLATAEPVAVRVREVAVREWLAQRAGTFSERCRAREIALTYETDIESWRFDPAALGRALDNLLDNALDHTPPGGRITVRAQRGDGGGTMTLRVCDTGAGVAPEIRPRLFEPFVSGRPDGVGLGLALVMEIAVAHGGTARYSDTGHGACFELEIP